MKYPNKFRLTRNEVSWARANLKKLTTQQMYDHVMANRNEHERAKYTTFRTALYKKGIKKCKIMRWSQSATRVLLNNYKTKGNIEIAKMVSTKRKKYTKKNVEKKMRLLGIKRTREQIDFIIKGHKDRGTYSKANYERWEKRKVPEGGRKVQYLNGRPFVAIKVNGLLIRYARYRYKQIHGDIPSKTKVYHKDMDPMNVDDDNLFARTGSRLSAEEQKIYDRNCKRYINSTNKSQSAALEEAKKERDDSSGKVGVRLDRRTYVFVKPGTNISELKRKHAVKSATTTNHILQKNSLLKEENINPGI